MHESKAFSHGEPFGDLLYIHPQRVSAGLGLAVVENSL